MFKKLLFLLLLSPLSLLGAAGDFVAASIATNGWELVNNF